MKHRCLNSDSDHLLNHHLHLNHNLNLHIENQIFEITSEIPIFTYNFLRADSSVGRAMD
jgi:hypothetical protein